jgi:hypothetical protein
MDFALASLISALISVSTAIIILSLQERRNKKRILKAVSGEIGSNLSLVKRLLPLAESLSSKYGFVEYKSTIFDLQSLYVSSYEDFRLSGYLLSLNQKTRELLEEVYKLIFSHNSQTEMLRSQQIDFSSPQTLVGTLAPRIGGYLERLQVLAEKLQLLQEEFRRYIKLKT